MRHIQSSESVIEELPSLPRDQIKTTMLSTKDSKQHKLNKLMEDDDKGSVSPVEDQIMATMLSMQASKERELRKLMEGDEKELTHADMLAFFAPIEQLRRRRFRIGKFNGDSVGEALKNMSVQDNDDAEVSTSMPKAPNQLEECSQIATKIATKIAEDIDKLIGTLTKAQEKEERSKWCKSKVDIDLDNALYLLCSEDIVKAQNKLNRVFNDVEDMRDFIRRAQKHETALLNTNPDDHGSTSKNIKKAVTYLKNIHTATGIPLEKVVKAVNAGLLRGTKVVTCENGQDDTLGLCHPYGTGCLMERDPAWASINDPWCNC